MFCVIRLGYEIVFGNHGTRSVAALGGKKDGNPARLMADNLDASPENINKNNVVLDKIQML